MIAEENLVVTYGYDLSEWEYDKVKRVDMIGFTIMQSMGLIEHVNGRYRLVRRVIDQTQDQKEKEEEELIEELTLEQMAERIDNLEIQAGALDVNMESLTNKVKVLNRNLTFYFQSQSFELPQDPSIPPEY